MSVCKRRSNQFAYITGLRLWTSSDDNILIWQEQAVVRCDGLHEGDKDVIEESVGGETLFSLDYVGSDGETCFSQTQELEKLNDPTLPLLEELTTPILPVTPIDSARSKHSSRDHNNQVMGDLPNTRMNSEPEGIQIGSQVCKRNKRGWRGIVREIDGDWAYVLWQFEKYPDRISLAELELLE